MSQESRNWMARFGPAFVPALIACSVIYGQSVITNTPKKYDLPPPWPRQDYLKSTRVSLREKFLGPAPRQVSSPDALALSMAGLRESSYVTVDDPRDFYHNVVVVLDRARDVNNGQPSALAELLALAMLRPGTQPARTFLV
jgi:hypothetical protein